MLTRIDQGTRSIGRAILVLEGGVGGRGEGGEVLAAEIDAVEGGDSALLVGFAGAGVEVVEGGVEGDREVDVAAVGGSWGGGGEV